MAGKFKTKFTNKDIYGYYISDSLKVWQVKSLIKSFTENANRLPYQQSVRMEELRSEIIETTGVTKYSSVRGRRTEVIGLGFSGKSKDELLEQLKLLQSYVREYYQTYRRSRDNSTPRSRNAWSSFKENYDNVDYDWYETMIIATLSISDIIHKFGSNVVVAMMTDYKKYMKPIEIAELARKVYNESEGKGLSKKQLADALLDEILKNLS